MATYKTFFRILIVLLSILFAGTAIAADQAYTVDQVKADATADNAADARERAFEQAQTTAFQILTGRLLSLDRIADFEMPPIEIISTLVQDFEILDEQLSRVRYIGTYRFRFKERAVSDFLSGKGLAHADVSSKPVLVLPFYQYNSRNILWAENNKWLSAWKYNSGRKGLVPVIVPIGDLQDLTDMNEEKAKTSDWSKLASMKDRYGAGEVMVLLAIPQITPQGQISALRIDIYTFESGQPEYANGLNIQKLPGENEVSMFSRTAGEVKEKLQQLWKDMTIADPRQTNEITVLIHYNNMEEWVNTKSALDGIKMFDELDVISLTPLEASLKIKFRGDESRLRLALSQKDLILSKPRISFSEKKKDRLGFSPLTYEITLKSYGKNQGNW